jgi:diadenosine tetraphosphate (Ap4A) HIT family hydrolase
MCIFCNTDTFNIICKNELAYAIYDRYPVNVGHVLIIPWRHIKNYFDLTKEELVAMQALSRHVEGLIEKEHRPDGYNIGFNINEAGGQTIDHCHMHVIPRYKDDVKDPRGGIRGVIPSKQKY